MYRGLCPEWNLWVIAPVPWHFLQFLWNTLLMGFLDGTCCSSRKASPGIRYHAGMGMELGVLTIHWVNWKLFLRILIIFLRVF